MAYFYVVYVLYERAVLTQMKRTPLYSILFKQMPRHARRSTRCDKRTTLLLMAFLRLAELVKRANRGVTDER